jgi:hypothetical protein
MAPYPGAIFFWSSVRDLTLPKYRTQPYARSSSMM